MKDGSYYQGEFKDDEITGTGKLFYTNGLSYEGDFFLGEKHGKGKQVTKD